MNTLPKDVITKIINMQQLYYVTIFSTIHNCPIFDATYIHGIDYVYTWYFKNDGEIENGGVTEHTFSYTE